MDLLPEPPFFCHKQLQMLAARAAMVLLVAVSSTASAQVQMGVTGLFSGMTSSDAAANLTGRGIATRRGDDASLLFPLGDGTTKATVRGIVSFSKGEVGRLTTVEFAAEGESAAVQYVSWLYQTGGRYGAPRARCGCQGQGLCDLRG